MLTFRMKAHLINKHLLVPRSRSSAKVKVEYQGYISRKMAISGALAFHKHIFFFMNSVNCPTVTPAREKDSVQAKCNKIVCPARSLASIPRQSQESETRNGMFISFNYDGIAWLMMFYESFMWQCHTF